MKSLFLTLFICILTEIISGQSIDYNSVVQIKTQASFNTIQNRGGSLKIAYLPPATEFNFYLDIWKGISKAALDNGHEVFMLAPQIDNPSEQMRMLESILETDVSALILSTHDENSAAPFIQQAIEMGKVVIIINSDARSYSTAVHGIVGYVQQSGTFKLGKYALSLVEGRSMSVAIIEGEPGYHSTERVTGFEDAIKNSNLKIIDRYNGHWNTEGGYKAAIEMFQDHRDIDMVFAANDFEIIGVSAAMESLRLNDIYLFGNDGVSSILPLIYDGRITATVNTDPINMGKVAMQVVLDSFSGKFQGGFVETPTEIITNDNVVSFLSDHDKEAIALNPVEIRVVSEELPGLVNVSAGFAVPIMINTLESQFLHWKVMTISVPF